MAAEKPFKILSIDGGGIRGVFPAMFLSKLEGQLKANGSSLTKIHEHFDLICGTSTGGIIAIALALGIPAHEIYKLYFDNVDAIFGFRMGLFPRFFNASYNHKPLEDLIRKKFSEVKSGEDPILNDCRTSICVPIYDLLLGKPSVLKTKHHKRFTRDYQIPAYMAAMATGSAPTYFNPYSSHYTDLSGIRTAFTNKVDGGVVANNPTMLGIIEAQTAFYKNLSELRVLSIGTGSQKFSDGDTHKWGVYYWMMQGRKRRLIDMFMQGQSQQVQNLVSLMCYGIDKEKIGSPNFIYHRIDTELDDTLNIEMDETDKTKLERLAEKASSEFQSHATGIIRDFCS